jgi:hypothetical protein
MVQLLWYADICLRSRPFIRGIHAKCDASKSILLVLKYSWAVTQYETQDETQGETQGETQDETQDS